MPKTRAGRLLYVFILFVGIALLSRSLYRKHAVRSYVERRVFISPGVAVENAINAGNATEVEAKLRVGFNPNTPLESDGQTPLSYAASLGRSEIVRILLAYGANPNGASKDNAPLDAVIGDTRFFGTRERLNRPENRAIIAMLRAKDVTLSPWQAVALNDRPALEAATRAGASLDGDSPSKRPLQAAIVNGDFALTRWLVTHGANVNLPCDSGETPLMLTIRHGNAANQRALIAFLLERGADINAANDDGSTALMLAANSEKTGMVCDLLLAQGAKTELLTTKMMTSGGSAGIGGDTALTLAAREGNTAAVRVLLAHGANIEHRGHNHITALMETIYSNRPQTARLLLEKGANIKPPTDSGDAPLLAAAAHAPNVIPLLLAKGVSPNQRGPQGDTPLILAARFGHLDAIETLLRAGAKVNAANAQGWTPLLWAAGVIPRAVPRLIASGADVNARSNDGGTPLLRAAYANRTEAVRLLLAAHADPNAVNSQGRTALLLARRHRRAQAVLDMLARSGAQM